MTQSNKPKRKKKNFKVGQVVYVHRHHQYGLLVKRHKKTFNDGWQFTIAYARGIVKRVESVVVESELRPLTKRERGE